ncbi:MAG TPA: type II toxin-antitoxin system RelB/DinJ family antitoxin [Candidatus Saccharimonadales bacterium]|nr:type II toxin-antitoxin system RelB/DinJ family antitoxin [Candidatus Saccharimonadales bacterium]
MTVLFRCRVEKPLLAKADSVTKSLGTSTAEMFRVFVAEIARTGKVPVGLKISDGDALMDVPHRNKIWSQLDDAQSW